MILAISELVSATSSLHMLIPALIKETIIPQDDVFLLVFS